MNDHEKTKEELIIEVKGLKQEIDSLKELFDKENEKRTQNEIILTKAMEKAVESDRQKTAFLSNISHEMRTPMNAIIGFLGLLGEDDIPGYPKEEIIKIITESSNQLLFLINDVIDFSKIEASLTTIKLNQSTVFDITSRIYDMFKLPAMKKEVEFILNIDLPNKNLTITTDEPKLRQVLINLVSNALKFTEKGSIQLGCSYNKGNENELLFYVKDTGIGIEKEGHSKVFERFEQSDSLDVAKYGGTGLGLSISKSFVGMLGGQIWIESEPGVGSTFYFTIPVHAGQKESKKKIATEAVNTKASFSWKGKTILIAEDSESNFQLYVAVFQMTGVNFIRAVDGQDAIEKLKEHPEVELVLMDIRMPIMDGLEATRRIREFNRNIPIIAQTAYAEEEDREKAMNAGCSDYQLKPVNMGLLFTTIDTFMK
jgi:signal transduction histidine kinase/CheY-like chemotaxis protein